MSKELDEAYERLESAVLVKPPDSDLRTLAALVLDMHHRINSLEDEVVSLRLDLQDL